MNPAFSVIFLTTLIGVGQGMYLALYTGQTYSLLNLLPTQSSTSFYGLGSLIALVFLAGGLIASFFHLGHPERAWRSAAQWRTSWLSREVIVLPVLMAFVFIYAVVHFFGWDIVLFTTESGKQIGLTLVTGALATAAAFALFVCTGMIYACIKFLQEWASPLTVVNYTLLGAASGFTLTAAFSEYFAPQLTVFYGAWAAILTFAAALTRSASLYRNAGLKPKSTLQSAIGIRHNRIQQKSMGFMAGSVNTRDFFHHQTQLVMRNAKWIFLILVFVIPLILLWWGTYASSGAVLIGAFVIQYLGLIVERWFFFAQANHPQNLYYQVT